MRFDRADGRRSRFRGDPATCRPTSGPRPVVALIKDRPGRFHYVVIVGWSPGRVIAHDPARAPFRVLDEQAFDEAWKVSGNWTLAATPPVATTTRRAGRAGTLGLRVRTLRDQPLVPMRHAAEWSTKGCGWLAPATRREHGESCEIAADNCPDAAGPWREMAGLHALATDWRAAAVDARKALDRDPGDALAARILATALYLEDERGRRPRGVEPCRRTNCGSGHGQGLERIRYAVASRLMALPPQSVLAPKVLHAARRKLAELPAAQTTRVNFRPAESGRAQMDAVVVERPLLPSSPAALAGVGLRAMTDREVSIGIASPSGGGEMWRAAWRWWEHRPRLALGFDAPAPFGGIWGINVFGERQSVRAREVDVRGITPAGGVHVERLDPRGASLGRDRCAGSHA